MKHTPGPWRCSARNIYSKELNTVIAQCWDEMIFTTEPLPVEANGRLIAAAPDLLEACVSALHGLMLSDDCQDEIDEIKTEIQAAIDKARGKNEETT